MAKPRVSPVRVLFPNYSIYIFESRHSSEYYTSHFDLHDFHELCLVKSGKGFIYNGKTRIKLKPGTMVYFPPKKRHKFEDQKTDPLTLLGVCFYDPIFLLNPSIKKVLIHFQNFFLNRQTFEIYDNYHLKSLMDIYQGMIFEQTQKRPGYDTRIFCQLMELLVLLSRIAAQYAKTGHLTKKEAALQGSLNFIQNHFTENIKIERLAIMAGMSYRSFTKRFKEFTGKTVSNYITGLRLDYAKKRLIESHNIIHSAFDAGFNDLANFYKSFKKNFGKTPKQYMDFYLRTTK
jgi:AraC-like DNA-binding protein